MQRKCIKWLALLACTLCAIGFSACDIEINIKIGQFPASSSSEDNVDESGLAYTSNDDGKTCTITGIGTCTNTEITIPEKIDGYTVTAIGEKAFADQTQLTEIQLPSTIKSIERLAFYCCSGLTQFTIPDSGMSIGNEAFWDCSNLTSITIPDSVVSIGDSAFLDCSKLENIYITDIAAWCKVVDGLNAMMQYGSSNKKLYLNNQLVTDLIIPDSVTSIRDAAFSNCSGLTSITIPDSVTWIGYSAFNDCSSLTSVFYKGTKNDWENIGIAYNNSGLFAATCYYYSETQSTTSGNYWHYVNGVPTVW